MKTTFQIRGSRYVIPGYMTKAIERYVEHHVRPGRFLQAVICNDLKGSMSLADDENFANLPAYIAFFHNEAPGGCSGSPKKMKEWVGIMSEDPA